MQYLTIQSKTGLKVVTCPSESVVDFDLYIEGSIEHDYIHLKIFKWF